MITHVRYNYRGVCNIPYQKREEVYNRSLFPITEVRRFPYNTQGLATNLANPNPAYYSRILGVMIKLNKYHEKTQLIMSILNQLKTTFHQPRLYVSCEIDEKPLDSIHSINTTKLLDVYKILFEIFHDPNDYILIIEFEKEQSPPVQEFINSLLDLVQMADCTNIGIWVKTEQSFVLPIEKIVRWLYRPQQTNVAKLAIVRLDIEVGEVQNTKDIVERLKKVIC